MSRCIFSAALNCTFSIYNALLHITGYSEQPNEVDKFFSNPPKWLGYHYSSLVDLPTHLIMFNSLLPVIFYVASCILAVYDNNFVFMCPVSGTIFD